ncbi:MAG TPA: ribose 5-phosphate isomerase B [Myxococcota bacterium]|nr:ribose 5-phosphate isomerase B [Myxococcota bacterium]
MKIALAADHAGFAFKEKLLAELRRAGHEVTDFGTSGTESCDYPDFAIPAVMSVAEGKHERAILACTNGIGMAMVANRVPGIRGALVYNARSAAMTRQHHDSNVLCLGAGEFPAETLLEWVRTWLSTEFEGGRHARRIGKVTALERK